MKPNPQFLDLPESFWAFVRLISDEIGYTSRKAETKGQVSIPLIADITKMITKRQLNSSQLNTRISDQYKQKDLLLEYFQYRANILNEYVEPRLMDLQKAKDTYKQLKKMHNPQCPIPMNKQKGKKRSPAYFTSIINILIEANCGHYSCNYDPHQLTTFEKNKDLVKTLSRRVDGTFQSVVNPVAIWEIKEYYYTTTFGSRVADGIYETLLDGMELQELFQREDIKVLHYLMVDAHYTWWKLGKSYLCRIIDMLHMGYVDEVLFGYEVVERLPEIVQEWISIIKSSQD